MRYMNWLSRVMMFLVVVGLVTACAPAKPKPPTQEEIEDKYQNCLKGCQKSFPLVGQEALLEGCRTTCLNTRNAALRAIGISVTKPGMMTPQEEFEMFCNVVNLAMWGAVYHDADNDIPMTMDDVQIETYAQEVIPGNRIIAMYKGETDLIYACFEGGEVPEGDIYYILDDFTVISGEEVSCTNIRWTLADGFTPCLGY